MMKKAILFTILFIGLTSFMPATWTLKNRNLNTRGITTIKFDSSGPGFQVKICASCSPKDCYWGSFRTKYYTGYYEELRRINATWLTKYDPIKINNSFVKRTVTIKQHRTDHGRCKVYVKSDYKNPNRKDRCDIHFIDRK